MAVKYYCRRCGKRFVDWGAEKLGFKCPDCDDEELVRVGVSEEKLLKRPSLKRKVRRPAAAVPATEEDILTPDLEEFEVEEPEVEEVIAEPAVATEADLEIEGETAPETPEEAEEGDIEIGEEAPLEEGGQNADVEVLEEPIENADEWPE